MSANLDSAVWYRVSGLRPTLISSAVMRRHIYRGETRVIVYDAVSNRAHRLTPVAHRFVMGFPGPTLDQRPVSFLLARLLQYALLLGIAIMLISGPLMVWANGDGIEVFDWGQIPSPFEPNAALYELMLQIHRTTRWALMIGVLAHVVGVFRSPAETLNRMLLAPETLQQVQCSHGETTPTRQSPASS